ncbi:uncharacterized protein LOC127719053 [Mytilus californianus]|uniref:uncharacterized protein LOC127719053 n=1 Tax=Mytilus californianus TaxID=6549 RepID=UPI002247D04C|nr:uncharacterized protein LOC127719053 [Mytilus californianus]
MIREIVFIVLLFPVTQQYPLEKKEIVLSESRLQNESPIKFNFIQSTTPYHLTKAHTLERKSRNVFKLPDYVLDGRRGKVNKSVHPSKSKLNKQISSNGVTKSRNEFKLPNNVLKTKGPNVWTTKGPNVWKRKRPNVWKTKGPNMWTTKGPNVWKTRGPNMWKTKEPNMWTTKGPNVWKTKGPSVWRTKGQTDKLTHYNIKTTSTTSANIWKTNVPTVMPKENVTKLSQTTGETNNIGTVIGPIVAFVLILVAVIIVCLLYKSKFIRINCTRQRQTINGEILNQTDIERQLINGQKEPIGIVVENGSD